MSASDEATLLISFPKALMLTALSMAGFVVGCALIGMPMHAPAFIGALAFIILAATPAFAACISFMLSCRIGRDGLRPAFPTFYQTLLRWEDIVAVNRELASPFYVLRASGQFASFCVLPRPFLLKNPDNLRELIDRYAPPNHIVREKLAACTPH